MFIVYIAYSSKIIHISNICSHPHQLLPVCELHVCPHHPGAAHACVDPEHEEHDHHVQPHVEEEEGPGERGQGPLVEEAVHGAGQQRHHGLQRPHHGEHRAYLPGLDTLSREIN